jgi:hypothetical protein
VAWFGCAAFGRILLSARRYLTRFEREERRCPLRQRRSSRVGRRPCPYCGTWPYETATAPASMPL